MAPPGKDAWLSGLGRTLRVLSRLRAWSPRFLVIIISITSAYRRISRKFAQLITTISDPEKLPLEPLKKAFHFYAKPTDAPEWMQEAYEKITKADGFIIVTPEYNGGIPAALSNMLQPITPRSRTGSCFTISGKLSSVVFSKSTVIIVALV